MSGIASINADTTSAQLLTVGSAGTDFAIADNGVGGHAFNLPNASATARGVISTGAQTIAGAKTFSSAPVLSSLTATTVPYLDASKVLTSSAVTPTELGLLSGKTSVGDFSGPASSTANALVRFSGAGGKTGLNSAYTLDNNGVMAVGTSTNGNLTDNSIVFSSVVGISTQAGNSNRMIIQGGQEISFKNTSNAQTSNLGANSFFMYPTPGSTAHYSQLDWGATTSVILYGSDIPVLIRAGSEQSFKGTVNGDAILGKASVATNATAGFAYIPSCAGTPTGTPTSQTGYVPLVCDSSGNKLYAYLGGAWVAMN